MILRKKATKSEIEKLAKHFEGYIKVVVDIKMEILAGGLIDTQMTRRHFLKMDLVKKIFGEEG